MAKRFIRFAITIFKRSPTFSHIQKTNQDFFYDQTIDGLIYSYPSRWFFYFTICWLYHL